MGKTPTTTTVRTIWMKNMCRIPPTHPFMESLGFTPASAPAPAPEPVPTPAPTPRRDPNEEMLHRSYNSRYQEGRQSMVNDVADAIIMYHVMDFGFDLFSAALGGKDDDY